jgi:hypothetical protein
VRGPTSSRKSPPLPSLPSCIPSTYFPSLTDHLMRAGVSTRAAAARLAAVAAYATVPGVGD